MIRAGAATLLLLASGVQAQTYPDYDNLYVNDYAGVIPNALEARLRSKLAELKEARGIEFTVLTIERMSDYGYDGAIEPFATGLFNHWGIGDATRNNGILLLVSRLDRELRIEMGAAYGNTYDAEMGRIIGNTIVPSFSEDAYYTGIENGTTKIIQSVTGRYPGEYDANLLTRIVNATIRFIKATFWWIIGIGTPLGLYFGTKAYRHHKRTKPRICRYDRSKMYWLTEEEEDAFLSQGQIIEERIKSMDHDVWLCRECDHIRVEAYPSRFDSHKVCSGCGFKTQYITKLTEVYPTRHSAGYGTAYALCKNCDHETGTPFTIPKIEDQTVSSGPGGSSSSSGSRSSSSSSFGGGRSGGGGASGSW